MPSIATAVDMVHAAFQAAFVTSAWTPQQWAIVTGQEVAADLDAFNDACCKGYGATLVPTGGLEVGTSQQYGGSLYTKVTISLMVFRCAPTIGDDLRSPTEAEHLAFTHKVLDDAERMLGVVWAVAQFPWITEQDISDPVWNAMPVDGGCGGGVVTFEMAVIADC